jgi:hypothetical protein
LGVYGDLQITLESIAKGLETSLKAHPDDERMQPPKYFSKVAFVDLFDQT